MGKTETVVIFIILSVFCFHLYAEDNPVISVMDFTTEEVSAAAASSIVDLFSAALLKTGGFTVIDSAQRDSILKEMEFSMSGCADESCMLEIGRMLAAEAIVTGHLSKIGSRFVLSVKMLDTESGMTLGALDGAFSDLDRLVEAIPLLSYRIAGFEVPEELERAGQSAEYLEWSVKKKTTFSTQKFLGISFLGIGVIGALTSTALMIINASLVNEAWDNYMALDSGVKDEYNNAYSSYYWALSFYNDHSLINYCVIGSGAALAVTGTILLLLPKKNKKAGLELTLGLYPFPGIGVSYRY